MLKTNRMRNQKLNYPAIFFVLLGLLCIGVSRCSHFPFDQSVSAADGNDYTVILSGYGTTSQKGYLFIQLKDAASIEYPVTLHFPPVQCDRASCIEYRFYRLDGSDGVTGGVIKGKESIDIPLSQIVGHTGSANSNDEGEYGLSTRVYFKLADGSETSVKGNGFIRLNILAQDYHAVGCDDPSVAWHLKLAKNCIAQFTTKYRTALCGTGC